MKKILKYVLPCFACAILVLSLSACGKIAGNKYRCDNCPTRVLLFDGKVNFVITDNGAKVASGTYKNKGSTITLQGSGVDGKKVDYTFTVTGKGQTKKTKAKLVDNYNVFWSKI